MALLTEAELRSRLRDTDPEALREYRVPAGTIVTPAARAYLSDHKIELVVGDAPAAKVSAPTGETPPPADNGNLPAFTSPKRYTSLTGGYFDEKPEHMTALRGTVLVEKDHPIIRLRGRLDSLDADVVSAQVAVQKLGMTRLVEDLGEVLAHIREILRCEVVGAELPDTPLLGMTGDEIHARSHTPKKYYGWSHFATGVEHGEAVAALNRLRAQTRETELVSYDAFKGAGGIPVREDLIRALNRLSSLFYVMMFRVLTKEYQSQGR